MPSIALYIPDPDRRQELRDAFVAQGFETRLCPDLDAFIRSDEDVVLTALPADGRAPRALLDAIKDARGADHPPVMLEGDGDEAALTAALEAGAADVFLRPYQTARLVARALMLSRSRDRTRRMARLEDTQQVDAPLPEDANPPPPQRRILHYQLSEELGRGGMGIVYKARDERSGAVVALKVLGSQVMKDRKFLARFLREIEVLRALRAPNVVRVLDSGVDGDSYFLAMELIEGVSTKQRLSESGPFAAADAIAVADGVGRALHALDESSLVHRDVKPANILLRPDRAVTLVDFGLAKRSGERGVTMTGEALGTPFYLAPEAIRGAQTDIGADVYALGVTLYELLSGAKPFNGDSAVKVFQQIFYRKVPAIDSLRDDLPPGLSELVAAMMARERDRRPEPAAISRALDALRSAG